MLGNFSARASYRNFEDSRTRATVIATVVGVLVFFYFCLSYLQSEETAYWHFYRCEPIFHIQLIGDSYSIT